MLSVFLIPNDRLSNLTTRFVMMFGAGEKVYIRVYSSNSKGRSTPVILKAETSLAAGVRKYFCFVLMEYI